jgi:hypothetical protein
LRHHFAYSYVLCRLTFASVLHIISSTEPPFSISTPSLPLFRLTNNIYHKHNTKFTTPSITAAYEHIFLHLPSHSRHVYHLQLSLRRSGRPRSHHEQRRRRYVVTVGLSRREEKVQVSTLGNSLQASCPLSLERSKSGPKRGPQIKNGRKTTPLKTNSVQRNSHI